jgi:hypothetical protein
VQGSLTRLGLLTLEAHRQRAPIGPQHDSINVAAPNPECWSPVTFDLAVFLATETYTPEPTRVAFPTPPTTVGNENTAFADMKASPSTQLRGGQ